MSDILNVHSNLNVYDDSGTLTNNPKRVNVDWTRHTPNVPVSKPESRRLRLMPGEVNTVFSNVRTTGIDNTSVFAISLNVVFPGTYRVTNLGGSSPYNFVQLTDVVTEAIKYLYIDNSVATLSSVSPGGIKSVSLDYITFVDISTDLPKYLFVDNGVLTLGTTPPFASLNTLTLIYASFIDTFDSTSKFLYVNGGALTESSSAPSSGAPAALRTLRSFNSSGVPITFTINNNATADVTIGSGNFNATVGDNVWVPGPTTGDMPTPFNVLNQGLWVVISASTTKISLTRLAGMAFSGVSETQTPTSNSQFIIFSSAGVQVGDSVDISAGFSLVTQATYIVTSVTPTTFEFVSTNELPLEVGILPGSTGLTFYGSTKRFVRIEVDQEAVVRFNNDTTNNTRLSPLSAGDPEQVAWIEKAFGPTWQLVIVNRSPSQVLNVNYISVE